LCRGLGGCLFSTKSNPISFHIHTKTPLHTNLLPVLSPLHMKGTLTTLPSPVGGRWDSRRGGHSGGGRASSRWDTRIFAAREPDPCVPPMLKPRLLHIDTQQRNTTFVPLPWPLGGQHSGGGRASSRWDTRIFAAREPDPCVPAMRSPSSRHRPPYLPPLHCSSPSVRMCRLATVTLRV